MIFISLGSQKFQFNRLLKAVDEQIADGRIQDEIFAQIGASDYEPVNFPYQDFLNRDEYAAWTDKAELVITHGGTGAIIGALKKGKKVIAVPRLARYQEHVDDHQLQLLKQFREADLICECHNCDNLWKAIRLVKQRTYKEYQSNTARIIESIQSFIENN